ncbi:DUF3080 family protein [Halomonas llamarensis]|uniref:DUF3080 domain-containing protein n=1 Tax=Halomonas llamarensis TaxID=2945104 RepID=A0ABT0SRV8_9GAMM|nr:DUF3080 family protein [Halomonas llamarensis]MCL7930555.1 DUF3080 domain-containing protein [Halomonas llamarensis]
MFFSLTGCGQGSEAENFWQNYQQQLSGALNTNSIERSPPPNIGAFPERQSVLFDISETRESLLNVYALRECNITSLVAARNNQLGRVAPPSQQWLYERELWQRISQCWNTEIPGELSDENRERLREITLTKTTQLPYVSWNAIFDSSEWKKSFSRASQPLPASELNLSSEISDINAGLDALLYLRKMTLHQFDRQWQQDSSQLENHLKMLQERPLTAELLRTLMLATQRLDEATSLLHFADQSRCLPAWERTYLDQLALSAYTWLSEIATLINSHPITPPAKWQRYYRAWLSLEAQDAPWKNFQRALTTHLAARREFSVCQASVSDE